MPLVPCARRSAPATIQRRERARARYEGLVVLGGQAWSGVNGGKWLPEKKGRGSRRWNAVWWWGNVVGNVPRIAAARS